MSILQSVGAWVVARAEERSTWTGLGALVATMGFWSQAPQVSAAIPAVGAIISAALIGISTGGGAR